MAFTKKKKQSSRCPICAAVSVAKAAEVDAELAPYLDEVRETGEIPKPARFDTLAFKVGLSPFSLRYHLKECLLDVEVQDQRILELRDLTQAVAIAKAEYASNPSMQNATAYTSLVKTFNDMADTIEGAVDPETTVEFVVEAVLGPQVRKALGTLTEEMRILREELLPLVATSQAAFIDSRVKAVLSRVSSSIRESTDESLRVLCDYYKVELETKRRKRALDQTITITDIAH